MGSLSEHGRTAWSVHSLAYHLFACCGPGTSPALLAYQVKGTITRMQREEFPGPGMGVP